MTTGYHRFVFNSERRKFVGEFEKMYAAEARENFDSWHQEDSRQLHRKIVANLLEDWNFHTVVDLGCGKGSYTHKLKRKNNHVLGLDLSDTAISIAASRFPDISFKQVDFSNLEKIKSLLDAWGCGGELFVCLECLSYLENWRDILQFCARQGKFGVFSLYLPENPIGFVKSGDQLIQEFQLSFEPQEMMFLEVSRFLILFGKSRIE